jgi:protein gp37
MDLWQLIVETPNLDWILVTKRVGNVERMVPGTGFRPNVIVLATIVDQSEANRDMNKLVRLKRSGVVRKIGVSYEPALGPVDWSPWIADLDWLIVGGESSQGGARARAFRLSWGRSAISQADGTGCAVFEKQMGSNPQDDSGNGIALRDRAGAEPSEWPSDLSVRQFPVIGG